MCPSSWHDSWDDKMDTERAVWRSVSVFNALLQDARNKQASCIILHRTGVIFAEIFSLQLEIGDGKHQMFNSSAAKKTKGLFRHDFLALFPSGSEALWWENHPAICKVGSFADLANFFRIISYWFKLPQKHIANSSVLWFAARALRSQPRITQVVLHCNMLADLAKRAILGELSV